MLLVQFSVPVTSPVTTITGLSMPGTLTGGAWSVETCVDRGEREAGRQRQADEFCEVHSSSCVTSVDDCAVQRRGDVAQNAVKPNDSVIGAAQLEQPLILDALREAVVARRSGSRA